MHNHTQVSNTMLSLGTKIMEQFQENFQAEQRTDRLTQTDS